MSCPHPFGSPDDYPTTGGDVDARVCAVIPATGNNTIVCCLPCPSYEWFYPDSFTTAVQASTYVNLAGVVCCCFLLLSFAVVSVEYTHRHYLSVCLTFAILLMQVSFVIPLSDSHSQCANRITPHDMHSSANCAASGALIVGGAWCTAMWIFIRTLSLHLQICWQMIPGRKFFLSAQAAGWSIPVVFMAVALSITGVSFRFGNSCHINSKDALQTFWGPLLGVAAASIVTQTITFVYCVQVYLRSLFQDRHVASESSLPYSNSAKTVTAAQALRRIQKVVALQWRGILVVMIITIDVIYMARTFLQFDDATQKTEGNMMREFDWLVCMLEHDGNKNSCLDVAAKMVLKEQMALSVLFLLSLNGILALLLLGRFSILAGWVDLFKRLTGRGGSTNDEFVSAAVRRLSDSTTFEMIDTKKAPETTTITTEVGPEMSPTMPPPRIGILQAPDNTSALPREYNPRTFSINRFRDRSESPTSDIFTPSYLDGRRSPALSSPYSSFRRGSDGQPDVWTPKGWERRPSYSSGHHTGPSAEIPEDAPIVPGDLHIGVAQ